MLTLQQDQRQKVTVPSKSVIKMIVNKKVFNKCCQNDMTNAGMSVYKLHL
jgi:hypothetical protein